MIKGSKLKLPPDFLGNVQKFLQTPPPPKATAKKKGRPAKAAKRDRRTAK